MDAEEEEDVEDGEINNGFLGEAEMENRKTLASAYGDEVSWVEAVLLGAKHLAPASNAAASEHGNGGGEGGDEEEEEVSCCAFSGAAASLYYSTAAVVGSTTLVQLQ